jgi:poly-gamma-glutamate synthesis protein (capsule biosynthesis protein)
VFGNFESPIVKDISTRKVKAFSGNPNFVTELRDVGFNIVGVANNHILEHGKKGFQDTLDTLNENNIKAIGQCVKGEIKTEVLEINGIRVGLAGFNEIHNQENNGIYSNLIKENILDTLENMKADIKVISLHWGSEYVMFPSPNQINFARSLIDNGADIIIGHHPHVIQPIEEYKKGVICYSLGNFIFDMHWSKKLREGLVLDVDIDENKNVRYNIKYVEIDDNYIPKIIVNAQKSKLKHNFYYKKMLKYHKMGELGNKKYKTLATRLRYLERIKSKLFWLKNIYKQPLVVRQNNFRRMKKKLIRIFKK